MDLMEMYASMTIIAKGIALVLFIMSMWSLGVGIERFFTFNQATNQSKAFAPLVAKALKDGKVKDVRVVKSIPVLDDAAVKPHETLLEYAAEILPRLHLGNALCDRSAIVGVDNVDR